MIENEHQRRITQIWVHRFSSSIETIHALPIDHTDVWVAEVGESALRSQLESLLGELAEYEAALTEGEGRRSC